MAVCPMSEFQPAGTAINVAQRSIEERSNVQAYHLLRRLWRGLGLLL